jgi:hypothetical protein
MTTSVPQPVGKYTIGAITPEDDFRTPGQIIPSQRVHFTTYDGLTGSVLVPDSQINDVAAVQTKVEGQIMALRSIKALGS